MTWDTSKFPTSIAMQDKLAAKGRKVSGWVLWKGSGWGQECEWVGSILWVGGVRIVSGRGQYCEWVGLGL